ncbi:alkaline phosphatase [Basidiobolus meristosporus CBS 931.73]|uniref:Alkaline phosphatase n=1 Tax=Basidiobolus meristosporus CBS 931.73 TaxID=1314790 RepID=A0A1Y1Y8E7_9FUNG|nr:alkaline phosphatase [Basidiobolus meristosporus CBS 931.73]|eukprot:ORX94248.1 alkaline phosphatase [Basidiobolus meristosporus CBS 931.73]
MAKGTVIYDTLSSSSNEEREEFINNRSRPIRRNPLFYLAFTVIISLFVGCIILLHYSFNVEPKRNVIMMISDGFGPASETYSRLYYQWSKNLPVDYETPLDSILVGASRTRSNSSMITDSAAGATAISCIMKTYNNAIGVDSDEVPCGTVLEAAKANGLLTGLVVTSRITHATPASFSSHVVHRNLEHLIAEQQIGITCRPDEKDLIQQAQKGGFGYIQSRKEFDNLRTDSSFPLLGLFALDHMDYDIDRDPVAQPSLSEMTQKALDLLSKSTEKSDKGFFLMVEGSRIDMAAHENDPVGHLHEILAYQDTVATVKKYVDANPGTVMISVSDHETGGFTVGRQVTTSYPKYIWYPEVISKCKKSSFALGQMLFTYDKEDRREFASGMVKEQLGITDATKEELDFLGNKHGASDYAHHLSEMVSVRAELGWTTHGHTGVDVNLYAYGADSHQLAGNHENTEIGRFIRNYLSLDLDSITASLKKNTPQTRGDEGTMKKLHMRGIDVHGDYLP